MWFPVSTIAALCVLLLEVVEGSRNDNDLEIVFRDRSRNDWENVWHKEKHTRCRETLIRHLYWACEKDIYRLTRRNDQNIYEDDMEYPWLAPTKAKRLLRIRRGLYKRNGNSITSECCKSTGCTWEEYAEYCPTNKRYKSYV